jgi:O-methyltransferase
MSKISKPIVELAKKLAFKHTKLGAPRYPYNVEPIQLATLVFELERVKNLVGNVVEIGVARGMTTRFISQHIINQKLDKSLTYYAIDTFESFTHDDLKYEVENRGKSLFDLKGFDYNDHKIWQSNFSEFPFVKAIKSDCSTFDYNQISPIKLTFLDVDLYLPTKKTLPKIFDATISGGVILVDDVLNNTTYDGAHQAYMEFCDEMKLPPKVIGNKCGFIQKI